MSVLTLKEVSMSGMWSKILCFNVHLRYIQSKWSLYHHVGNIRGNG